MNYHQMKSQAARELEAIIKRMGTVSKIEVSRMFMLRYGIGEGFINRQAEQMEALGLITEEGGMLTWCQK